MITNGTHSTRLDDAAGPSIRSDADSAGQQEEIMAPAQQWAARLARLDLDAESLEMIMAALTANVCDDIGTAPDA